MVTVPNICTDTPALSYNPVIAYLSDNFQKPQPFSPDVVIAIDEVIDKKLDMLHCHTSQMYEWLPFNAGHLDQVPESPQSRREWLRHRLTQSRVIANQYRDLLIKYYGAERGSKSNMPKLMKAANTAARSQMTTFQNFSPFSKIH